MQWRSETGRERPERRFAIVLVKPPGSEPADGVGVRRRQLMLVIPPEWTSEVSMADAM